jgi:hypothetical protein
MLEEPFDNREFVEWTATATRRSAGGPAPLACSRVLAHA